MQPEAATDRRCNKIWDQILIHHAGLTMRASILRGSREAGGGAGAEAAGLGCFQIDN